MLRLVSLTPCASAHFSQLTGRDGPEWFCTHDPEDRKLGSGGGTLHLLRECWRETAPDRSFGHWLGEERGLLLHAGGQSRRLPAYAAEGKALLPVPVFRWSRGQRLDQILLDLQIPFLERLLSAAKGKGKWLVASGDVLLRAADFPKDLPDVDVAAVGMWGEPDQATRHGVFFAPREDPGQLAFVRQKPSLEEIRNCARGHYFLLDVGAWILSDRALRLLAERCGSGLDPDAALQGYDLYGEFGLGLGKRPTVEDPEINALTTALLPLKDGEFYHFGSGPDLIHSALRLQNLINDQRRLSTTDIKPHPSLFVQNSQLGKGVLREWHSDIWIENACVPEGWELEREHLLTGIPDNAWKLSLPAGSCLEILPLQDGRHAVRTYGFRDAFRGAVGDSGTQFHGQALPEWLRRRGLTLADLEITPETDLQQAALFPVFTELPEEDFLQWLFTGEEAGTCRDQFIMAARLSAEALSRKADVCAREGARRERLKESLPVLARHAERSVFYQVDLEDLAGKYAASENPLPEKRPDPSVDLFRAVHDAMFRSRVEKARGNSGDAEDARAFSLLREAMITSAQAKKQRPEIYCLEDQIVWGRSPVRLDLAGGWTDTPPYCFLHGGKVVNLSVELNGQPPIQVFARRRAEPGIRIRSIDLGNAVELSEFDDIRSFAEVGSGFAIPKAALALCGFLPEFHPESGPGSLREQLDSLGGGLELALLCAVPKGSGLGTSSLLAATVLGVLNDVCQLGWDFYEVAQRVLVLEQMLTSGGGWQDQYGGIFRGLKYLETGTGLDQRPRVRWLDDHLFTDPSHQPNILLYYTGITRVAKSVLGEIVRGMFLNSHQRLDVLNRIGENAARLQEGLQEGDYALLTDCVRESWQLNQALDEGTNPPAIAKLLAPLEGWLAGAKLLGAGGGGYLLMFARDATAAQRIKTHLQETPPNAKARFVSMAISGQGLHITRS